MKRIIAIPLVVLVMFTQYCLASSQTALDEYIAWAEKAWVEIDRIYHMYHGVEAIFAKCCYTNGSNEEVYPPLDFLLLPDLRMVSEEQYKSMQQMEIYDVKEGLTSFERLHDFVHDIDITLDVLDAERSRLRTIPDEYAFLDSHIMRSIDIISDWHQDSVMAITNGANASNVMATSLRSYGVSHDAARKLSEELGIGSREAFDMLGIEPSIKVLDSMFYPLRYKE